ncbi:MAG TPA: hypothetical protein VGK83_02485, partial [Acidimicrobiia bacterium]
GNLALEVIRFDGGEESFVARDCESKVVALRNDLTVGERPGADWFGIGEDCHRVVAEAQNRLKRRLVIESQCPDVVHG